MYYNLGDIKKNINASVILAVSLWEQDTVNVRITIYFLLLRFFAPILFSKSNAFLLSPSHFRAHLPRSPWNLHFFCFRAGSSLPLAILGPSGPQSQAHPGKTAHWWWRVLSAVGIPNDRSCCPYLRVFVSFGREVVGDRGCWNKIARWSMGWMGFCKDRCYSVSLYCYWE